MRQGGSLKVRGKPHKRMARHNSLAILLALLVGLVWASLDNTAAKKVYVWRDKEGKIHFSGQRPHPDVVGGDIKEKKFKDVLPVPDKMDITSRSPIEHAVKCTFRLSNKKGGGSGFFINDSGLAVTARHVVKGVSYSMKAELPGDNKKYSARILKRSREHDLALLKVSIYRPTPFLEIRDVKTLVKGEEVWAIGNPLLAFRETVTKGTFSRIFPEKDFKKDLKSTPPYKGDWIQFSAQVTSGNSGGPVVDKDGKLVGVVSMGVKSYGAVNFAVPSSYILKNFKSYLD